MYDQKAYEIVSTYAHLSDGETASGQVCPSCKGGDTQEKSLSVTRRGGLLVWNCHRASCKFRGGTGGTPAARSGEREPKGRTVNVKTYPIDPATVGFLATKYGISRSDFETAGLRWTGDGDGLYQGRVCYPIYGPDLRKRGESYRSYKDGVQPKAIIRINDGEVCQCWYKWKRVSRILVIVEDQVSAIKLAPYYHTVALLGTNLSEAKAEEIAAENYEQVWLALDNDATHEAIKLVLKWQQTIKGLRVIGLGKDIKNMSELELDSFMLRLV